MGWTANVISARPCDLPIWDVIDMARRLAEQVIVGSGELFAAMRDSMLFLNSANNPEPAYRPTVWLWNADHYLWLGVPDVEGGIDIAMNAVSNERADFILGDIAARNGEWRDLQLLMQSDHLVYEYSLHINMYRSAIIYFIWLCIVTCLAECTDGYVYTIDNIWFANYVPLTGPQMRVFLTDREQQIKTGFTNDIHAICQCMRR